MKSPSECIRSYFELIEAKYRKQCSQKVAPRAKKKSDMKYKFKSPQHRKAEIVCANLPYLDAPSQFHRELMDEFNHLNWKCAELVIDNKFYNSKRFHSAKLSDMSVIHLPIDADKIIHQQMGVFIADAPAISLDKLRQVIKLLMFA